MGQYAAWALLHVSYWVVPRVMPHATTQALQWAVPVFHAMPHALPCAVSQAVPVALRLWPLS